MHIVFIVGISDGVLYIRELMQLAPYMHIVFILIKLLFMYLTVCMT